MLVINPRSAQMEIDFGDCSFAILSLDESSSELQMSIHYAYRAEPQESAERCYLSSQIVANSHNY